MNALQIERLRIALPAGDGDQAVRLVQLVAARLAAADSPASGRFSRLGVNLEADAAGGEWLDTVADRIVRDLLAQLGRAA